MLLKINNFQGELNDISGVTATLVSDSVSKIEFHYLLDTLIQKMIFKIKKSSKYKGPPQQLYVTKNIYIYSFTGKDDIYRSEYPKHTLKTTE